MEITDMQITDLYAGCLDGSMDGIWHVKRLPCLSVVQALEGRYDVQLGGGAVLALEEGDVFVTMPAVEQRLWHHDSRETGRMRAHWMFFNVRCAGGGYLTDLYEFPARLPVGCSARVRELIGGVLREGPCLRYARAFEMTDILLQNAVRRDGAGGVYLRVKDYILENLGNNEALSGKRLAAYAHASRSSFYRNFKDLFGMTASAYIRQERMSRAAFLLEATVLPVGTIADGLGFYDAAQFAGLFKQRFGITPTAYRKAVRRGGTSG